MKLISIIMMFLLLCVGLSGYLSTTIGSPENDSTWAVNSRAGRTEVNNFISSDTKWTVANSPYLIKNNILVKTNVTLTIDPGVVVKFDKGFYLQIDGALIAKGTETKRILFTSNSSNPGIEDWEGIIFEDASDDNKSVIEYSTIEYAKHGIGGYTSSPLISYNIIRNNYVGINIEYDGIARIFNNTVENNNWGILLQTASGNIEYNTLINDIIRSESNHGKSIIKNNVLINSEINAEADTYISNNSINGKVNISSSVHLTNNTINGSIVISQENIIPLIGYDISFNNIFGDGYTFINDRSYDINATNNYWGTTDANKINQSIFDYYDDPQKLGKIYYLPFLKEPSPNAPKVVKNNPPLAEAGADKQALVTEWIIFDSSGSTDPEDDILTYRWDFGDGNYSTMLINTTFSHLYSSPGVYTVTLTVSDGKLTKSDTCFVTVLNKNIDDNDSSDGNENSGNLNDMADNSGLYFIILGLAVVIIVIIFYSVILKRKNKIERRTASSSLVDSERIENLTNDISREYQVDWQTNDKTDEIIDDLKEEALIFEKPSDFEITEKEILDRITAKYEKGEISKKAYDLIAETMNVNKR